MQRLDHRSDMVRSSIDQTSFILVRFRVMAWTPVLSNGMQENTQVLGEAKLVLGACVACHGGRATSPAKYMEGSKPCPLINLRRKQHEMLHLLCMSHTH